MSNGCDSGEKISDHKKSRESSTSFYDNSGVQINEKSSVRVYEIPSPLQNDSSDILRNNQNYVSRKNAEVMEGLAEKYRFLTLNTNDLIAFVSIDVNPVFTFINPSYKKILGYGEGDLLGKSIFDFIDQDDKENLKRVLFNFFNGEIPSIVLSDTVNNAAQLCLRFCDKSEHWHVLQSTLGIVNDELLLVSKDVSENHKIQESVDSTEGKYKFLYNNLRDGFAMVDLQGRITECNNRFIVMLGYSFDELRDITFEDITPQKWHMYERRILEEQVKTRGYSDLYEKEYIHKDGMIFPVELQTYAICDDKNQLQGFWIFIRDISERKKIEMALRKSEERFRLVTENASDVIWSMDLNFRFTYFSPSNEKLTGYRIDEALNLTLDQLLTPDSVERALRTFATAIKSEAAEKKDLTRSIILELNERKADGTIFPTETRICFLRDADNNPIGFLGITRDITERKKAEEILRESEEKYRGIVENTQDVIMLTTPDGRVAYMSPACFNVIGYNPEDIVGKNPEILYPDDVEKVHSGLAQALQGKRGDSLEYRVVTKNGEVRWVSHSWSPIMTIDKKLKFIVSIVRNITDSKLVEQNFKMKIEELERYKDITVNRELKMLELKKENMRLRELTKKFDDSYNKNEM